MNNLKEKPLLTKPNTQRILYKRSIDCNIIFRFCREKDLYNLEWFGMFYDHREIIQKQFQRQLKDENYMIIADLNSFPIAQVWIDLTKKKEEQTGVIWALRVMPPLQSNKLGTELIEIAENILVRKNYWYAEMDVEKNNHKAKKLYERLGYNVVDEICEKWNYTTPYGTQIRGSSDLYVMIKEL